MSVSNKLTNVLSIVDDFAIQDGIIKYADDHRGFQYMSITPYFVRFREHSEVSWVGRFGFRIKKSELDSFKSEVQGTLDSMDQVVRDCKLGTKYYSTLKFTELETYGEYKTIEVLIAAIDKIDLQGSEVLIAARKAGLLPIPLNEVEEEYFLPKSANFLSAYMDQSHLIKNVYLYDDYSYFRHAYLQVGFF